jgi:hypothetical protein
MSQAGSRIMGPCVLYARPRDHDGDHGPWVERYVHWHGPMPLPGANRPGVMQRGPAVRDLKIPILGSLSVALFAALWWLEFVGIEGKVPSRALAISFVLALLHGWPALFALARSLGAGAFGRSTRAALIVLGPVAVTLALAVCDVLVPDASWPDTGMGIWVVCQLVAVPACWGFARLDFARRRPSA